jgi:hypothetical protein
MRTGLRPRIILALALVLLVGFLGATLGRAYVGEALDRFTERGPVAKLVDLRDVTQLGGAFDAAAGTPRLVLLLSPT